MGFICLLGVIGLSYITIETFKYIMRSTKKGKRYRV